MTHGKDAAARFLFSARTRATPSKGLPVEMPLLLPFPATKQPEPARAQLSRQEWVEVMAARYARGEDLWANHRDWRDELDPTLHNKNCAWRGQDRENNGTDKPNEMSADPLNEFADDDKPYPSWEEDLAAWRGKSRPDPWDGETMPLPEAA